MRTISNHTGYLTRSSLYFHQLPKLLGATILTAALASCEGGSEMNDDPDLPTPDIDAAGEFTLLEEKDYGDPSKPPVTETDIPVSDNVTAVCTTEGWTASEVRELTDVVGLDLNGTTLYPGALLQGASFEDGQFVPITIPRAPGTLYMTGLVLDQGAQYFASDVPMSGANVNQTIQQLITDYDVQGTAANASYQEEQAYSYEQMLFELGIDGRYGLASMSADLSIDSSKTKNYVFSKFTQVFYDIVYEDPQLATSVFRDGADFYDPEGQIGPGNPPLYVSKVSYGRMVFFVAESEHNSQEVQVALSAAVRGGAGSGTVDSGLTYEQVMARSKVYYYAIGGSADLALSPIGAASPGEMFNAVKSFISDRDAANFSASNPGAPISYTLNYLKDRSPARMSYVVNYDKKDCDFLHATPEPQPDPFQYRVEVRDLHHANAKVLVNGKIISGTIKPSNSVGLNFSRNISASDLRSGWNDVQFQLRDGTCAWLPDNEKITAMVFRRSTGSSAWGGNVWNKRFDGTACFFDWNVRINTTTGSVQSN